MKAKERSFDIVVATDKKGGIGFKDKLPWRISEEMERFRQITIGGTVIMGRKTSTQYLKSLDHYLIERI